MSVTSPATNPIVSAPSLSAAATAAAAQNAATAANASNANTAVRTIVSSAFVQRELMAGKTPANRPIDMLNRFQLGIDTANPVSWKFQLRSTAQGNGKPFAVPFVMGHDNFLDGRKVSLHEGLPEIQKMVKDVTERKPFVDKIVLLKEFLANPKDNIKKDVISKWLNRTLEAIKTQAEKSTGSVKAEFEKLHSTVSEFINDPSKPMPEDVKKTCQTQIQTLIVKAKLTDSTDFKATAASYDAFLKTRSISELIKMDSICRRFVNLPNFEKIPGFNITGMLPVQESTGLAPYHPVVHCEKEEVIIGIAFDDAGTQFGVRGIELGGTDDLVLIQGKNPKNGTEWSDWMLNPISDADMEAIEKENKVLAEKIMKNALNVLLFKGKKEKIPDVSVMMVGPVMPRHGCAFFAAPMTPHLFALGGGDANSGNRKGSAPEPKSVPKSLGGANVGITTGGLANDQRIPESQYTGKFIYVENSAMYLRISNIACRAIVAEGSVEKTPKTILQLADSVTEAGDKALASLA